MSDGTTPSLRDEDNPPEETGTSDQKTKTPPPLPSSNPVVKEAVPTGDLIQFDNEEEQAATVGESSTPMDTTASMMNPNAITLGDNSQLKAVLENFLKDEHLFLTSDYTWKYCQLRVEQDKLRATPEYSSKMAIDPKHTSRNRYRDILPYDKNRVVIRQEDGNWDGYMNASHIELAGGTAKFIASQAPLPTTLEEWWSMIDDQKITLLVILCGLIENGKVKCERYWPEMLNEPEMYGEYEVTVDEERTFDDDEYVLRVLTMEKLQTGETRKIHMLHYREWPDHGCPTGNKQLINFIDLMDLLRAEHSPDAPILVHCSAGVGRTGTIIAINYIREQIKAEKCENIDIWNVVMELRKQRTSSVQTHDQYVFIHRCIATYCRRYLGLPEVTLEDIQFKAMVAQYQKEHPEQAGQAVNLIAPPTPTTGDGQPSISNYSSSTQDSIQEDEGDATSVPDFPDEPPAPKGPEDLGDSAAN